MIWIGISIGVPLGALISSIWILKNIEAIVKARIDEQGGLK